MRTFSVLLKDSLNLYRTNFKFLISIVFLSYFWGLIIRDLQGELKPYLLSITHFSSAGMALYGALHVISPFLTILGYIAIVVALKGLREGGETTINSTYSEAIRLFLPVLVVFIIEAFIILGGFIFFIAPGIIFSIWYLFSLYAAVVHRKRKAEALALSKAVVRTSIGRVIGYVLVIEIFGSLPSILFYFLVQKGVFSSSTYLFWTIIHGIINSILTIGVRAFLLRFYSELIKVNPQISQAFELEG